MPHTELTQPGDIEEALQLAGEQLGKNESSFRLWWILSGLAVDEENRRFMKRFHNERRRERRRIRERKIRNRRIFKNGPFIRNPD